MNAYKCDICGKLYCEDKPLSINGKSKDKWKVRLGDSFRYADICDECTFAIQEVIDFRKDCNEEAKV